MDEEYTVATEEFTEATDFVEPTNPVEVDGETTAVVSVDYTPVIYDATNVLANIYLAGALMIVGCLIALKFWGVDHK